MNINTLSPYKLVTYRKGPCEGFLQKRSLCIFLQKRSIFLKKLQTAAKPCTCKPLLCPSWSGYHVQFTLLIILWSNFKYIGIINFRKQTVIKYIVICYVLSFLYRRVKWSFIQIQIVPLAQKTVFMYKRLIQTDINNHSATLSIQNLMRKKKLCML